MSITSPTGTAPVQHSTITAADSESTNLGSLQSSSNNSHSTSSLQPRTMSTRKPVPHLTQSPVAFPIDNYSHPERPMSLSSYRRLEMSGPSATPQYNRTMSSPSPPPRQILRSPFVTGSANSFSMTYLSSSLTRNSSVPASLTHNVVSSNIPVRSASASVSQPRPSLSSPSPPTPIVPSIPLRHATQRSPVQLPYMPPTSTLLPTPRTPNSAPTTLSRGSMDRQSTPRRPLGGRNSSMGTFTNASDPNLPSRSSISTPVIEPNYRTLPLKQLLAKPLNPSSACQSGSEYESHSHPYYGNHTRSASTSDSTQFAIARRNSQAPAIELAAVGPLSLRSPITLSVETGNQTRKDDYHYRRKSPAIIKNSEEQQEPLKARAQAEVRAGWLFRWKSGGETERRFGKDKLKDEGVEPRPRNVLRRRPSNLTKLDSRNPPSDSPRLSRSLSASSLFKRANLFTSLSPNVRAISPLSKSRPSDTPGSVSPAMLNATQGQGVCSHDNRISAQQQHHQNTDIWDHTVTTRESATEITRIDSPDSKRSSPGIMLSRLSSPPPRRSLHLPDIRLSTISSESSATTNHTPSRDKNLSPAGAVADAYKLEQLAKDAAMHARPLQSYSSKLPLALGNSDVSSQSHPPQSVDMTARVTENSRSSSSGSLSYAELNAKRTDVAEKTVNPTGETKEATEGTQQPLLEPTGLLVTREVTVRSSFIQSPQPSTLLAQSPQPLDMAAYTHRSSSSSPLASPPLRTLSAEQRNRNRLRKPRHASDQDEFAHSPYYTVVGSRIDQVYGVGSPRDSFGVGYSELEKSTWGIRTTITAGADIGEGEKDKPSIGKSLSRKLSGKFRRPRSAGGNDENMGSLIRERSSTWQDARAPPLRVSESHLKEAPKKSQPDDQCLPSYLYSVKKHAQSEMDLSMREKEKEKEKDSSGGGGGGGSMFPRFFRMFGRSKSRERNEVDAQTETPPALPALPKHYVSAVNDVDTPIYSRSDKDQGQSPRTHKSPRSRFANKTSPTIASGRPSTATRSSSSEAPSTPVWNRTHSIRSSVSSLVEVPPMPSPLPDLTRYATDDVDLWKSTQVSRAARIARRMEAKVEGDKTDVERSESPPIPMFSIAEPINSFPPRRSSERSKSSPTSPTHTSSSSPMSLAPPRPARSPQRSKIALSRTSSFSDEALYPPVMNQSNRSIPKMTFRQMDSEKRQALTEQEKSDRWAALLKKSDAAGGTLHFGDDGKLASDELRFSRTLSELGS